MRRQRGGYFSRILKVALMPDVAKVVPSRRSEVPVFMVMDVMAMAARIEAAGGRVIHMEVGQPAAPAPSTALAAAHAALGRAASLYRGARNTLVARAHRTHYQVPMEWTWTPNASS